MFNSIPSSLDKSNIELQQLILHSSAKIAANPMLAADGKVKRCPICKESKPLSDFDFYYSKERNKHRPQNYCKVCQKPRKKELSSEYYKKNCEARKQYATDYRANPIHKPKRKKVEQYFKKKYREELQDCYVADYVSRTLGITVKQVRETEGLIEAYKAKLKLIRKIKQVKNEKQIN